MRKSVSKITVSAARAKTENARGEAPSVPYEAILIESLKDPREAAAYLEAALEDGSQAALTLALRHVSKAWVV